MRKLLLASAAVIGGVAGGQVMAQTVVNTAVPLPHLDRSSDSHPAPQHLGRQL